MSRVVDRNPLTSNQIQTIKNSLKFTPNVFDVFGGQESLPINFYIDDGNRFILPYLFSSVFFKIRNNNVYPKIEINFLKTLRENQNFVHLEALSQLDKFGTTTLGLYTGFGKTVLGAKLTSDKKLLTVILIHRDILIKQWTKTFNDFTDAKIWIVDSKHPIPQEFNVIICMSQRWKFIPETIRNKVGMLIVDEAHCFCVPSAVDCLLAFQPKYVVVQSATLERDDGMHNMIYSIVGTHGVFREIDKPFHLIKWETGIVPERKMNRRGKTDWANMTKQILYSPERNKMAIAWTQKLKQRTILVLTSQQEHVHYLYNELLAKGESVDYMCGTKRAYNNCRILVGTVPKIGTGFDQETFCDDFDGKRFDTLIMLCSYRKYNVFVQCFGRIFRSEEPLIIQFIDSDSIYEGHWRIEKAWAIKRGGKIHILSAKGKKVDEDKKLDNWAKNKMKQLQGK